MIKPNELRLQNYVNHGGVVKVSEISGYNIGVSTDEMFLSVDYMVISPIPLTEEWLVKFGFEQAFVPNYFRILVKRVRHEVAFYDTQYYYLDGNRLGEVKYIHQLQNLYFALTGEELQLKQ